MGNIKNTFKWSHSRQKRFEECRRRFYLNSYAIWGPPEHPVGGWDSGADDFTKLVYRLSKLQNIYTWPGRVVHDAIEGILDRISKGWKIGQIVELLRDEVVQRLRANYRQSLNEQAWIRSPKWNTRLFEHHYGIEVNQDQADELKANILTCLDNFLASETFELIRDSDPRSWKPIEEFASFQLSGFEVALKMDFAMELNSLPPVEGKLLIIDWKTGKWQAEEHIDQMAVYALYAANKWGYPPEDVTVRLLYLRESDTDAQESDFVFSSKDLKRTQRRIKDGCRTIQTHLRDPEKNIAHMEDFPMTEERWRCKRCSFVECCYRTRDLEELQ